MATLQRVCCKLAVGFSLAMCAGPLFAQPAVDGQWSPVIDWPIQAIHGIMLPNDKLLVWQSWATSAALWDPATGNFEDSQFPSVNIFCSGHAWLPDGRLLVVGGQRPDGISFGEPFADIYDPYNNTWASQDPSVPDVPAMGAGRWYPSATTLGNGDVLVMSGDMSPSLGANPLPQVYDHQTNTWRNLTGAMQVLPLYPRTFLAPDGRVISLSNHQNETQYIDVAGTGSWETIDNTLDGNLHNYGPAVMYDAGKIAYLGGGHNPTQNVSMIDLNDANPAWRYGADDMAQPRRQNDATILADGTVLITGGTSVTGWNDPAGAIPTAEIWDPVTEQVTQVAAASDVYRGYHTTATLLPDGRVLVTGGDHDHNGAGPFTSNRNAEIYEPAYLHKGPRPTITNAPTTVNYGDTFFVETPDADSIARALMVVPGATTHAQNWTQRANRLDVTLAGGGVEIELTDNSNDAPPGNYMLFLIDDNGVPSVAEWVMLQFDIGLPGDFNRDGVVNAADYTTWRDGLGSEYDQSHYNIWVNNYGATSASGSATSAIPEPTAPLLLLVAVLALAAIGSRKTHP